MQIYVKIYNFQTKQIKKCKNRLVGVINIHYSSERRPGRNNLVLSMACSSCHALISFGFPLSRTSGTFQPLNSAGLVYTGGETRPS